MMIRQGEIEALVFWGGSHVFNVFFWGGVGFWGGLRVLSGIWGGISPFFPTFFWGGLNFLEGIQWNLAFFQ